MATTTTPFELKKDLRMPQATYETGEIKTAQEWMDIIASTDLADITGQAAWFRERQEDEVQVTNLSSLEKIRIKLRHDRSLEWEERFNEAEEELPEQIFDLHPDAIDPLYAALGAYITDRDASGSGS
jgi:predicted phosphohydrolase